MLFAVQAALSACVQLGGSVCVPAGTYTISLPTHANVTDTCLAVPSDCLFFGEGAASLLKFAPEVNGQGWWRMIGPALKPSVEDTVALRGAPGPGWHPGSAHNITITDLHLHGNTNHTHYPCFKDNNTKETLCDHVR